MCDLRSALARSYPFALLAGCPVNTFLVRGWMPYLCGICSTAVLRRMNREPPGFCLLSKTGIARGLAWYLPDSYLCVLLDGHHKATAAALEGRPLKHWCSARQPILMMSNKPWYFLAGNVCTKQSCNTHIPKTHRVQNIIAQRMGEFRP